MKKKFSIFVSMLVLIVSLISTIPIYAAGSADEYYYSSLSRYHTINSVMATYSGYICKGLDSESPVSGVQNNIFSVSTDKYWLLGVRSLKYGTITYYVVSPETFSISVNSSFSLKILDYDADAHFVGGTNCEVVDDEEGLFVSNVVATNVNSSEYSGYYYYPVSTAYISSSSVEYDSSSGGWYLFDVPEDSTFTGVKYLVNVIIANYSSDLSSAPGANIDESAANGGSGSSGSYQEELGFLQNIQCTTLVDKTNVTNTSNEYAGDKRYKISYGLTTSSGFDLRSSGAGVEYAIKIKGGYTTLTNNYVSLPTVVGTYKKVGAGVSYYYIESSELNELYGRFRNDASLMAKTIDSQIYIYMRPISRTSSGSKYGGWSRIKFDKGNIQVSNLHIDNGVTPDGSISCEPDGEEDNFNVISSSDGQSSYGEGNGFDDAESNARPSGTNSSNTTIDYDADAMMNNLRGLVAQVGQIPLIISDIFSFLPSWCLTLFGVGFALVVFLIIYKLIRG